MPCAGQHRNDIQASGRLVNLPLSIPSCLIFDSSSHAVYVSQPKAVADLIAKAAHGVVLAT
jgi:hypothetical protein